MTILTDGKHTVAITMAIWTGNGYGPDFSNDFFAVGSLHCDDNGRYHVPDVVYCLDQADDWAECTGDYADDGQPGAEKRYVDYTVIR